MNKPHEKTKKPFALSFLKEIPEAQLEEVVGGNGNGNNNQITTLAISSTSVGKKDKILYDEV